MKRLTASLAMLLFTAAARADYYPQIRTKGGISSNEVAAYYDGSGRYLKGSGYTIANLADWLSRIAALEGSTNAWNVITNALASTGIDVSITNGVLTITHEDTSTQVSVTNSGGTVFQRLDFDSMGHVTNAVTYDLDGRYFTETESDARYATAAQGALANTATQPGDDWSNTVNAVAAATLTGQAANGQTAYGWGDHGAAGYATNADLTAHVADPLAAHAASAISFSATGNLASTNVQTAVAEVDSEKLAKASNLSDLSNAATARSNLGLIAGGAGDIWVEKQGDTMPGNLTMNDIADVGPRISFLDGSAYPTVQTGSVRATSSELEIATATDIPIALIPNNDLVRIDGGLNVGGTTAPGDDNLRVEGTGRFGDNVNMAGNSITNASDGTYTGTLATTSYVDRNAITPIDVGNLTGLWTIDFTAGGVQKGTQTDTITNVAFTVASTNYESAVVFEFFSNGGSVTWNTNTTSFVGDAAPTMTSNEWNRLFMSGYRGRYYVGKAGSAP